ncbi:zinc finger BED domain-containing protein 1 [Copidosoma floridanum]|uniref:zinc finger BED domain-containing protein 1 n=1 Tax=Copidosoma floridanum TaxID=29053 RepID=UPI0006C95E7B|nr:zinc finger BED domain-containing protein 1 [Copidosoma floridanum]
MEGKRIIISKIESGDTEIVEGEFEPIEITEHEEEETDIPKTSLQNVFAKFLEEKHSIPYKKLVVPQSMRSIYWKFFGFPATAGGEILTRVKIVCLLCKTQIAYNRNTSNLRMHLQNKHTQELHDLESASPPRKQNITPESKEKRTQKRLLKAALANSSRHIYTTNADGTVHINGDIQFITDTNVSFPEEDMNVSVSKPIKFMVKNSDIATISTNNTGSVEYVSSERHPNQSNSSNKSSIDAILEFLIIDLQLPDIVQEHGFQRFVATFNSPCDLPSKSSLEEIHIPAIYNNFKETILSIIDSINGEISLAAEEWVSNCGETFITFLIYYQNLDEAVLESKMLCTVHAPQHWDVSQWEKTIKSIFENWHIDVDKVTAVVASTNREEFITALSNKGLAVIPCLLHTLQVCAQSCFNDLVISSILDKCRATVGTILNSPESYSTLLEQEQISEGVTEYNAMALDCTSCWISTYNMLHQLLMRREIINDILPEMQDIDLSLVYLTNEEWQSVSDIVESLQPLKDTIYTLSEEKMPHISLLKPLLWQLVTSHLKVKDDDTENAREIKDSLIKMLSEKYADQHVNLVLQIATVLDPRFKEVQYASDEDKKEFITPIREMLIKLIIENKEGLKSKSEDEPPTPKKSRPSGMERLLGGLRPTKTTMTPHEKASLEIAQYQSESALYIDYCPLEWWSKVSAKCPNLGKIASRYNCVPLCCPPLSRISTEMQMAYSAKRAALPPQLIDKLLFLHANYNLVQD